MYSNLPNLGAWEKELIGGLVKKRNRKLYQNGTGKKKFVKLVIS